jgi:hypothetical protein
MLVFECNQNPMILQVFFILPLLASVLLQLLLLLLLHHLKEDQLARYNETCHRADMPPPQPHDDLPPLNTNSIIDPDDNGDDVDPVGNTINESNDAEVARILLAAGNYHQHEVITAVDLQPQMFDVLPFSLHVILSCYIYILCVL